MLKRVLAVVGVLFLFAGVAHADWFEDKWGEGGTLEWLRIDGDVPAGVAILLEDPPPTSIS